MLGDGGEGDVEVVHELFHRPLSLAQELDDATPVRVRDRLEDVRPGGCAVHEPDFISSFT